MSPSAPTRSGNPFRVLIVRTGAMGDVLHAMPAVAAMRLQYPDWQIGWAIEPRWRSLLEAETATGVALPLVNFIHEVPTRAWNQRPISLTTLHEIRELRGEMRAKEYNLCVDMQGLLRSAVVGWIAGADRFAGTTLPRETPARLFYGTAVHTMAPHVIDRGCELLGGALGEKLTAATVPLPVDEAAERWCDTVLAQRMPDPRGRFAVIAPTAGWGAKCWPAERFGALAKSLHSAGYAVLVNASTENDSIAAAVMKASGGCAQPVVCTLAQLTALLRRTSMMIAGDTGPLHLAAALGRPVVALFGPTNPVRTGPYGTRSEVLRSRSSCDDHRRHDEPEIGLLQITVEEVTAAAFHLMQNPTTPKGDA